MGSPEVGCSHVIAHLWQYLDHEVDRLTCEQLETHLAGCAQCQHALELDRRLKERVRRCTDPGPIPRERLDALLIRVRQRIEVVRPPEARPPEV